MQIGYVRPPNECGCPLLHAQPSHFTLQFSEIAGLVQAIQSGVIHFFKCRFRCRYVFLMNVPVHEKARCENRRTCDESEEQSKNNLTPAGIGIPQFL